MNRSDPPRILLTGSPGCGKSTVIRSVIKCLPFRPDGFHTREILRGEIRYAFETLTLDGKQGILAGLDLESPHRVGPYGVNIETVDQLAVPLIRKAAIEENLLIIDEIGPMQFFSAQFCQAVLEVLDSRASILGTIVQRSVPFADQLKARDDITIIEVTLENRDNLPDQILQQLQVLTGENRRFSPGCDRPR